MGPGKRLILSVCKLLVEGVSLAGSPRDVYDCAFGWCVHFALEGQQGGSGEAHVDADVPKFICGRSAEHLQQQSSECWI